ncbi:MAG: M28 family peptidase [Candidatus Acidiferrales bacterium]
MKLRRLVFLPFALCLLPLLAQGQSTPVIPEKVWKALENELSGDIAFDHLRYLTLYHSPNGGTDDFRREAEWVAEKARAIGLDGVQIIWMKANEPGWNLRSGEAWLLEPVEMKLGDVRETPLRVATNSRTTDVTAELVDVGAGTSDADYEGKDVKGKAVLASGFPGGVQEQAVWKRGALGVITYVGRRDFLPDQLAWLGIPLRSRDEKNESAFAWILTPREGERLRARLKAAKEGEKAAAPRVRVKITADFGEHIQGIVEGWIRGTEIHDQAIILTAHLQEEKTSANDDRSGCASLLEIGRTLTQLINEGKLPRPRRDIRFWWVDEISAPYQYFAEHPEEAARSLVELNQDMVGAKQSLGGRVQFLSRTPFSRPSFLNAVMESAVETVRQANTAFPLRGGVDAGDFSRPLFATLGTREPYRAEAVAFYDSTDHLVFNDGRIGIPGISLTNWPDPYIHSTDDDLWQIDATQLRRNAFIVAATAYYIALAGEPESSGLAAVVLANAQQRLARDSAAALLRLADESAGVPAARYADAALLLEVATQNELATVDSARALVPANGPGAALLASVRRRVETLAQSLRADLDSYFKQLIGSAPSVALSDEEKAAGQLIPERTGPLAVTMEKMRKAASVSGIHGHYSYETRNLVDGQRSVLDIYRIVRAETISAGEWYYGPVTLAKVREVLESAEKAGAIRFRSR